eukprot:TRINITY_DN28644_c0_g1_i1.p2 TRINITY_DN28644_c0_g1~~TRINITY_DN28644_c0_g1_i1.p2  ORF type:complete len:138 (-),score=4.65 TRINITY_DN28644_c0_g1_i1:118-471(-)
MCIRDRAYTTRYYCKQRTLQSEQIRGKYIVPPDSNKKFFERIYMYLIETTKICPRTKRMRSLVSKARGKLLSAMDFSLKRATFYLNLHSLTTGTAFLVPGGAKAALLPGLDPGRILP